MEMKYITQEDIIEEIHMIADDMLDEDTGSYDHDPNLKALSVLIYILNDMVYNDVYRIEKKEFEEKYPYVWG